MGRGPISCRASTAGEAGPGDRQIPDATAAEVARRGGILGISFYPSHLRKRGRTTLDDVVRHAVHLARAARGPEHVGLGTDLDGGIDYRYGPIHDLGGMKNSLRGLLGPHVNPAHVNGIMMCNWF